MGAPRGEAERGGQPVVLPEGLAQLVAEGQVEPVAYFGQQDGHQLFLIRVPDRQSSYEGMDEAFAMVSPRLVFEELGLVLDRATRRIYKYGERVKLRPREYLVLACLLSRPNALITQTELLRSIDPEHLLNDRQRLHTIISCVKKALGWSGEDIIENVRKMGYVFNYVAAPHA